MHKNVIRIAVRHNTYDINKPWLKVNTVGGSGTGFVFRAGDEKIIVTNYHVISTAFEIFTLVPEKYKLQIVAIYMEFDLAFLKIHPDDEPRSAQFFKERNAIEMGEIPEKGEKINIIGYPSPGISQDQTITSGTVSRIFMVRHFKHMSCAFYQTDATINSGNSGGPAVNKSGKLVGIATISMISLSNTNGLITNFLLARAIKLYENKQHSCIIGSPGFSLASIVGTDFFKMNNINPISGGMVCDNETEQLQRRDYVFEIDGFPLVRNFYINGSLIAKRLGFEPRGLLAENSQDFLVYSIYFSILDETDKVNVKIYRSGVAKSIVINPKKICISNVFHIKTPGYVIIGYFTIRVLNDDFFKSESDVPKEVMQIYETYNFYRTKKHILYISDVASEYDTGYKYYILTKYNDSEVSSLEELIYKYKQSVEKSENVEINLKRPGFTCELFVYFSAETIKNTKKIIKHDHDIDVPEFRENAYIFNY